MERDGRAPGKNWIRTEFGWKPLSELKKGLGVQLVKHLRQLSRENGAESKQQTEGDNTVTNSERVKLLRHALNMRCVSTGNATSRESCRYSTISDAVQKLNFHSALNDNNFFPFICKVLCLIFDGTYHSSSGSLQMSLLRLVESATNISINTRMYGSLATKAIDKAISANEKVRQSQLSTFAIRHSDSRIKTLIRLKQNLQDSERAGSGTTSCSTHILDLPDDCLTHIMRYLSDPRDLLNLQLTCYRLSEVGTDNQVWKALTYVHFEEDICETLVDKTYWMDTFVAHYKMLGGKLKLDNSSNAAVLCKLCKSVFWTGYGHPCCGESPAASALAASHVKELISPQDFINLFSY